MRLGCVLTLRCARSYASDLAGDVDDLSNRLQQLAFGAAGAPLMTVDTGDAVQQQQQQQQQQHRSAAYREAAEGDPNLGEAGAGEDWELV
jgi:hypothetical protein